LLFDSGVPSEIRPRDSETKKNINKHGKKDTLWLFNIAMEAMAHRNRWFTWVYLLKTGIFHGHVSHNQMASSQILETQNGDAG